MTDGTQGPDISTIPSIALRQVEVLRDGASAQYGSDAIAGVMNFLLQDAREGGSLELTTGTYRAGDGDAYNVAGNVGLPLGNTGFANLSFEYGNADPTNRSVQRADAAALIAAGNTAVADPAQIWGDPTTEDDLKLFGNFGHAYANGLELYGHANYAGRTATQGFYYRNPNTRANIFSLDSGRTLLVGDALDARDGVRDGSAGCPTVRITDNRPDQAALAQVRADPDCFSFQEIAPGGFTDARSGRQRHRAVDVPGRPAPGRPAARARDVDQRDGRAGGRHRTVHADRRLLTLATDERALLLSEGIASARTLAFFRFFINDFATRTRGLDVVSTYTPPRLGGDTVLSFAMSARGGSGCSAACTTSGRGSTTSTHARRAAPTRRCSAAASSSTSRSRFRSPPALRWR